MKADRLEAQTIYSLWVLWLKWWILGRIGDQSANYIDEHLNIAEASIQIVRAYRI